MSQKTIYSHEQKLQYCKTIQALMERDLPYGKACQMVAESIGKDGPSLQSLIDWTTTRVAVLELNPGKPGVSADQEKELRELLESMMPAKVAAA